MGCRPDLLEGASPLKLERRGCLAISATHDFQCKHRWSVPINGQCKIRWCCHELKVRRSCDVNHLYQSSIRWASKWVQLHLEWFALLVWFRTNSPCRSIRCASSPPPLFRSPSPPNTSTSHSSGNSRTALKSPPNDTADHSVIANSACIIRHGNTLTSKTFYIHTPENTYTRPFTQYKETFTGQKPFAAEASYTKKLVHQTTFSPKSLHQKPLTETLQQKTFTPKTTFHQTPFTPDASYTRNLFARWTMNFYTRNHLHQKFFTSGTISTSKKCNSRPLHQNFLLRNSLQPGALPNKENLPRENLHKKVLKPDNFYNNCFQ